MQVKAREIIDHEPTKREMERIRWKLGLDIAAFIAKKGLFKVTHAARKGVDKKSENHIVEVVVEVPHEWEGYPELTAKPPVVIDFKPTEAAYEERILQRLRDGRVPAPCQGRIVIEIQAEDLE